MASYLIFIPDKSGANPQHLRDAGLGDLLADGSPIIADSAGPDNRQGVVCWWDNPTTPDSNPSNGYFADRQTWEPSRNEAGEPDGRFWLGWETARPVRPEDIERRKMHDGERVELSDGNRWLVPMARQLPCVLGIGGRKRLKVQYKEFFDLAMRDVEAWIQPDGDETGALQSISWSFPYSDAFEFAVRALALNYRLSRDIADMLGLISTDGLSDLIPVVADGKWLGPALAILQKKTARADSEQSPPISAGERG